MTKKIVCALVTALLCFQQAVAEENTNTFAMTGSVHDAVSPLAIAIADTGTESEDVNRNHVLCATISTEDGHFSQQILYCALESPSNEPDLLFARLEDLNFDGYADLILLTAAGSANVYSTFALWNPQLGRFDPVMMTRPWISAEQRFAETAVQMELCNVRLLPESGRVCSEETNGSQGMTRIVYRWMDDRTPFEESLSSIYQAENGMIGEKLEVLREGESFGWNQQYPGEWYYGEARVEKERMEVLDDVTLGNAVSDPVWMQVADADGVNVRLEDCAESPSIARLDAGCRVQVLKTGCGEDGEWVRVWYIPGDGNEACTGYIQYQYLK